MAQASTLGVFNFYLVRFRPWDPTKTLDLWKKTKHLLLNWRKNFFCLIYISGPFLKKIYIFLKKIFKNEGTLFSKKIFKNESYSEGGCEKSVDLKPTTLFERYLLMDGNPYWLSQFAFLRTCWFVFTFGIRWNSLMGRPNSKFLQRKTIHNLFFFPLCFYKVFLIFKKRSSFHTTVRFRLFFGVLLSWGKILHKK